MTERTYKVGDVVAWADVPDGALVRESQDWHALRLRGRGIYVGEPGADWLSANPWSDEGRWPWNNGGDGSPVTIVALGVPADATAAELQRLAEVFEVREALSQVDWSAVPRLPDDLEHLARHNEDEALQQLAERLHAAGWRKGRSAEDAARLLAEASR